MRVLKRRGIRKRKTCQQFNNTLFSANLTALRLFLRFYVIVKWLLGLFLVTGSASAADKASAMSNSQTTQATQPPDQMALQVERKPLKKVVIFGGTGMIGKGVLRECLEDKNVESVVAIGRRTTDFALHEKLREVKLENYADVASIKDELKGVDATFYAMGTSSNGLSEQEYENITKHAAVLAAGSVATESPDSTFVYVSGTGADVNSSLHWARTKAEAENAILSMPLKGYVFRPGAVRAMYGEESQTTWTRLSYFVLNPVLPLVQKVAPNYITTTVTVGQAFLHLARYGDEKKVFENADLNELVERHNKSL